MAAREETKTLVSGISGDSFWGREKRQFFDFLRRLPTWKLIPNWEPKGAPFVSLRNFLISLPVPKSEGGMGNFLNSFLTKFQSLPNSLATNGAYMRQLF